MPYVLNNSDLVLLKRDLFEEFAFPEPIDLGYAVVKELKLA